MARFLLEHGIDQLMNVHDPAKCAGRPCTVHMRSAHRMRSWPQLWRGDRGLMERRSPMGVSHPDPDDLFWREGDDRAAAAVHGCVIHPATGLGECSHFGIDGSDAAWLFSFLGYAVTRDGRIWSWHPDDTKEIDWTVPPEEVLPEERRGVHPKISIIDAFGRWQQEDVRSVVWLAWRGERSKSAVIRHIDGDRFNNAVENLEAVPRGKK